jgi:hypothetical protein
MNMIFQEHLVSLKREIQQAIPAQHQGKDICGLVISGLAIRCGISPARISSMFPGATHPGIRVGLSRMLMDPQSSVGFFSLIDRFENDFRRFMKTHRILPDVPGQIQSQNPFPAASDNRPLRVPPMPLARN